MFASKVTKEVPVPSDPSITVTIRRLSWLQLEQAQKAAKKARQKIDLGGVDVPETIVEDMVSRILAKSVGTSADDDRPASAAVEPDLLRTHDQLTVLQCGVKAWSVPEPVDRAHLEDLDPGDAEALARAILALSAPRSEADRKNGSSGSIGI